MYSKCNPLGYKVSDEDDYYSDYAGAYEPSPPVVLGKVSKTMKETPKKNEKDKKKKSQKKNKTEK